MARKFLPLTAALLAAAVLAGCAVRALPVANMPSVEPHGPTEQLPNYDFGFGSQGAPELSANQQLYGSAGLLAWPSVLVSLYLNEAGGATWTDGMIEQSRANLAVAVDWITTQAARYNAAPKIAYDDGSEDSPLCYTYTYDGSFIGGDAGSESNELYDYLDALCETLDTDALHKQYGTSSVGFLVFLPVSGCAFTMVHYQEDASSFYYEYSCLYAYDVFSGPTVFDSPSVYAHEILHLFGAPDLYEGSQDGFASPELTDYVLQTWPDAIMYDTYGADDSIDYTRIDRALCPLTAYRLGLCNTFAGIAQFPDTALTPPGAFAAQAKPEAGDVWGDTGGEAA